MYILGLDLGTTAIKTAVIGEDGKVLATAVHEYTLLSPKPSEVELPVEVYWSAFKATVGEVLEKSGVSPRDIGVMGMSVQGETFVPVDREGKALCNAIVWLDNRAQEEASILNKEFPASTTYEITGQVSIVPTWPAAKLLWLKNHSPEIFEKAHKFLLLEDYFIFRLTGKYVAEGSLLSSTVYWDIRTRKWWTDMLDRLGVEESRLPEIRESGEVVGPILPAVAAELGLSEGMLVSTGALDQAAGAIGVGNVRPGLFSENTGAALAICATLDQPFMDPDFAMPCHYHGIPGLYMAHTFTSGGMVLKWLRDKFFGAEMDVANILGEDSYDLLARAAAKVPAGSNGLIMLPHLEGAMAPEDNPKARGVFFGFSLHHGKPHFVRATMESIAYIVRRNVEVLKRLRIPVDEVVCLGGGSKSPLWNQIKADVLNTKVVTTQNDQDAACLGAAFVAGKAAGIYSDLNQAIEKSVAKAREYMPIEENRAVYDRGFARYVALYEHLVDVFEME